MKKTFGRGERAESIGEHIANSVSHGVGLLAALAAMPILIVAAARGESAAAVVGTSVFAAAMVLMYLVSTLYHALPRRAKPVFQVLDHGAIFLLIAGSYTPFTLAVLRGAWGWTLFGLVWGLAAAGIALKAIAGIRYPRLSLSLYLGMGWLAVIAAQPLWLGVPRWSLFWLVAGGIAYTVGAGFFAAQNRLRYSHFIWHLFVIAGSACHFFAVLYAL